MPGKYSHSVVLAQYSSQGLIDLPNDQYRSYLKTCRDSRNPLRATDNDEHPDRPLTPLNFTRGFAFRQARRQRQSSEFGVITSRSPYRPPPEREIIAESDDGSADERVLFHAAQQAVAARSSANRGWNQSGLRGHQRRLPEATSTSSHRSDSLESETRSRQETPVDSKVREWRKEFVQSVINLNDLDLTPTAPTDFHRPRRNSSPDGAPAPSIPIGRRAPFQSSSPSMATSHDIDLNVFEGFSEACVSERTLPAIVRQGNPLGRAVSAHGSIYMASADGIEGEPPHSAKFPPSDYKKSFDSRLIVQPTRPHSYDTISSVYSKDILHMMTALPPLPTPNPLRKVYAQQGRLNGRQLSKRDHDDIIDPTFFETLREGPKRASDESLPQQISGEIKRSSESAENPSQPDSRRQQYDVHVKSDPEFWHALEGFFSAHEDAASFPPDIARNKSTAHAQPSDEAAGLDSKTSSDCANRSTPTTALPTTKAPTVPASTRSVTRNESSLRNREPADSSTEESNNKCIGNCGKAKNEVVGVAPEKEKGTRRHVLRKLRKRKLVKG